MPKAPFPPMTGQEKKYEMLDLGYKRTPCHKAYEMTVCNRVFRFPAQVVIDSRDEHYDRDIPRYCAGLYWPLWNCYQEEVTEEMIREGPWPDFPGWPAWGHLDLISGGEKS